MTEVFLGIDIGGSHIGVGCISAEDGTLLCLQSLSVDAHDTFDGLIELICKTVVTLFEREASENCSVLHVLSIGIGCPGQCKDGVLIGACIFREFANEFSAIIPDEQLHCTSIAYLFFFNLHVSIYRLAFRNVPLADRVSTQISALLNLDGR